MWRQGEIQQGDSGKTVSDKLDAEFMRLQSLDNEYDNKIKELKYTTLTTVKDRTIDKEIVSPYTLWSLLDPINTDIDNIKKVTDSSTSMLFDGRFWIRTTAMYEYTGAHIDLVDLAPGYMITKAHLVAYISDEIKNYIRLDGTVQMWAGYVPVDDHDVATKEYVDETVSIATENAKSEYVEFPPAVFGDKVFAANIGSNHFAVYVNGILTRRIKYAFDARSITFHDPLEDDDEVTIIIMGSTK